jgi:DNA repair exonuclease SbcCD nuclease subunit
MKVLLFSDMHLHNWNYGSILIEGVNSRLLDQAKVMDQIAEYVRQHKIEHVIFAGDLFHSHGKLDASVLKVAYEGIDKIAQAVNSMMNPMDFIVGNHDTAQKDKKIHSLHWLAPYGNVTNTFRHDRDDYHWDYQGFSYLSYTENVNEIKEFFKKANPVCIMHQGIAGVPMGSGFLPNEMFTLDMIPDHVEHVFTGHYHQHNTWSDKATIIGSTMQLNWADAGDKRGFIVFDTDENVADFEFIESVAPKFVTFNMLGRGSADYIYNERLGKTSLFRDNFVRVINYNSTYTFEIREGLLEAGARSVEFVLPKVANTPLHTDSSAAGFDIPKLVAEYEQQQGVTEGCSTVGKELMK